MTAWRLPDDCMTTAWRLLSNCLATTWRLLDESLTTTRRLHKLWLPNDWLTTAWRLPDDCLTTAWRLPDVTTAWQLLDAYLITAWQYYSNRKLGQFQLFYSLLWISIFWSRAVYFRWGIVRDFHWNGTWNKNGFKRCNDREFFWCDLCDGGVESAHLVGIGLRYLKI